MKMKNLIVIFYAPPIHPASCEKKRCENPYFGFAPGVRCPSESVTKSGLGLKKGNTKGDNVK